MSIDNSIVKKIAKLSRIKIKADSENQIKEELNNILGWVETLQKVDTSKVEPMLSVLNEQMPMRNDKVENDTNNHEEILSNAPEKKSGFFVVPKVVE